MTLPDSPPPGLPPANPNDVVIRPSRTAYSKALRANAIVAVPLLVVILLLQGARNPIVIPIYVVLVGLSFGILLLYFRVTSVRWGDGVYTYRTFFGLGRTFRAADAGLVITITSLQINLTTSTPDFIVLDKGGRKLMRLHGTFWSTDDLGPMANDLAARGVQLEPVLQPVTALQIRQRHPGAIRWWEAHRIAFTFIMTGAILLLAFVAVAVIIVVASSQY